MCHDELELNRERRELTEEHTEIRLEHDEEHRWCLDCHNPDNRDMLRLASGELVEFTESYRLCGQCHGPKSATGGPGSTESGPAAGGGRSGTCSVFIATIRTLPGPSRSSRSPHRFGRRNCAELAGGFEGSLMNRPGQPTTQRTKRAVSRRGFLRAAALTAGSGLLASCDKRTRETFLQQHFRELTREELARVLSRLEAEYSEKYGKAVTVSADPALEDVLFGYGLDLSRCVGCRRCVYSCAEENNCSRDPQVHLIRVLEMEQAR